MDLLQVIPDRAWDHGADPAQLANITMNKVFCTAPWNGLTIREDGTIRTCCVGGVSLGNLNAGPIESIEQLPALKEIRQQMQSNTGHKDNCSVCLGHQLDQAPSLRDYYNRYYQDFDLKNTSLKVVDLRWNNLCNLKCMYCTPMSSSTWASVINQNTKTIVVKDYHSQLAAWIISKIHDLQELMLVGGEPMLMKQNYEIINHLPRYTKLSIITNLSYDLKNLPCIDSLLQRPKENTIWNVSIENVGKQFEFARHLSSWEQVEQNLRFLCEHWPNSVSINFVYSMFSAFDIVDTFHTIQNIGIRKFNLIQIEGNREIDVLAMPDSLKSHAATKLALALNNHRNLLHPEDIELYPVFGANTFLSGLQASTANPITKHEFYKKIKWYNQWSDNKFEDLWPHVMELVDLHLQ